MWPRVFETHMSGYLQRDVAGGLKLTCSRGHECPLEVQLQARDLRSLVDSPKNKQIVRSQGAETGGGEDRTPRATVQRECFDSRRLDVPKHSRELRSRRGVVLHRRLGCKQCLFVISGSERAGEDRETLAAIIWHRDRDDTSSTGGDQQEEMGRIGIRVVM